MISYKVLIILTFTINISHSSYSEEQIRKECDRCVDNLKLLGFTYDLPFINYVQGIRIATNADTSKLDEFIIYSLTEDKKNTQREKYGDSVLEDHTIRGMLFNAF
ncbi:uncharacterized protein LOC112592612 [Melanaphis sacchari]|uniref:uncharacterized protein LOC112592612 n=1 Tax=Melanaphis sacchari TaxID=742174 RepID=UPI000DC12DA5|nr:uncharacterized protein LOC112592612 [Melanaphis sacchari]